MATTAPPEIVQPHPFRDERICLRAMGLPALADDDEWICPACGRIGPHADACHGCGRPDPWPLDDDQ